MKYIAILTILLFCFACQKEEDRFEKSSDSETDKVVMRISTGGEFVSMDENPLTKAITGGQPRGVLGIRIYSAPLSATDDDAYTPYAYGLFDDWTSLGFTALKESKYKIEATMLVDASNKLYMENGVFQEPLGVGVGNAFIYSESVDTLRPQQSLTRLKDGKRYTVPEVDRYYGEKVEVKPVESTNVTLFLKRVVFGVRYVVSGLTQGKILCELDNAPAFTINPADETVTNIYCLGKIRSAWDDRETETRYSETYRLKVSWIKPDGTSKVLAEQDVNFKRRMQTNVRMTIKEASETLEVVFEDQAMGNGGSIGGDTDDGLTFLGSISLTTQKEVDDFGAKGYSKAVAVYINNAKNDITDLSPLLSLKGVDVLSISDMVCDSVYGLNNIEMVNELYLTNCTVKSLSALNKVKTLNQLQAKNINTLKGLEELKYADCYLADSPNLTSLEGLNGLKEAFCLFSIMDCGIRNTDALDSLKILESMTIFNCNKLESVKLRSLQMANSLNLSGDKLMEIDLRNLLTAGDLTFYADNVKKLDLNRLWKVRNFSISDLNNLEHTILTNLEIAGQLSFTRCDLSRFVLTKLQQLSGKLQISYCTNFSSLRMEALESVGGNIIIGGCSDLRYIREFSKLQTVGGDIDLSSCDELVGCDGFMNVRSIGGNLKIRSCSKLLNVYGFNNLESIQGNLDFSSCKNLRNVDDFSKLKSVGKDLKMDMILSNTSLNNLGGLSNVESIGGSLVLRLNGDCLLPSFKRIEIAKDVTIYYSGLPSLSGLESLTRVNGNLSIEASITSLDELSNLTEINGNLTIISDKLTSLEGLKNVQVFNGGISISSSSLGNLSGLRWPAVIPGSLYLECANVTDLTPLRDITAVQGDLTLYKLKCATMGMPALERIEGSWTVKSCSSLTTLKDVAELKYMNGGLFISQCSNLGALPVFSSDLRIEGYVEIADCSNLTNIGSLENINSVGRMFRFTGNSKLSNFCSIQGFLTNGYEVYTSGNLYNPTKSDILNGRCSK